MPLLRKVKSNGGSFLVVVPIQLAHLLDIDKGTILSIALENNKLVMSPVAQVLEDHEATRRHETTHEGDLNE